FLSSSVFLFSISCPSISTLFPYTTLFRSPLVLLCDISGSMERYSRMLLHFMHTLTGGMDRIEAFLFATRLTRITRELSHWRADEDRKSTRLNSSHEWISYAVFCLKKKKQD